MNNGIKFVGPNYRAMELMGDKLESKRIAALAGVESIPGYEGEISNIDMALQVASQLGYPVMVKASAGGGGKGMRICWNEKELIQAFSVSQGIDL
jgi:propionyl-CoA carboxylase alpha chain